MGGRGAGGGGKGKAAGGGGAAAAKPTKAQLAKLDALKKELGSHTRYSPEWMKVQQKYRALYGKIYGPEKATI